MSEDERLRLLEALEGERELRMARWDVPGAASERVAPGDLMSPPDKGPARLYEPPEASDADA